MTRVARSTKNELEHSPVAALVWPIVSLIAGLRCAIQWEKWHFAIPLFLFAIFGFWYAHRLRKRKALYKEFLRNINQLESICVNEGSTLPDHCIYCGKGTKRFVPVEEESENDANILTEATIGVKFVKKIKASIPVCHKCQLLNPEPTAIDFEEGHMCFYVHQQFAKHLTEKHGHNKITDQQADH